MSSINPREVVELYENGWSPYAIAEKYSTYTNKIRRMLVKEGVQLRDKGAAQKVALAKGRSTHPTEGRERTQEEKLAISISAVSNWQNMSSEDKEVRKQKSKENWDSMTLQQKTLMREKAVEQIRKAAKDGSKLERKLAEILRRNGYSVQTHKTDLIPKQKLEIDLFLPQVKTIIEVDGISHFEPIWGDQQLLKQQKADAQKDGTVLSRGYNVVRIEAISSSLAIAKLDRLEKELISILKELENESSNLKVIKYE